MESLNEPTTRGVGSGSGFGWDRGTAEYKRDNPGKQKKNEPNKIQNKVQNQTVALMETAN